MADPLRVFISYVPKDDSFRSDLYDHLTVMKREKLILPWSDRDVSPGADRVRAVSDHLDQADLILFLISPSFLASDYCNDVEVERALARHDAGQARAVPVVVRPCDWQDARIGRLRPMPRDGKPVSQWSSPDEAWSDVARELRRAVKELQAARAAAV